MQIFLVRWKQEYIVNILISDKVDFRAKKIPGTESDIIYFDIHYISKGQFSKKIQVS